MKFKVLVFTLVSIASVTALAFKKMSVDEMKEILVSPDGLCRSPACVKDSMALNNQSNCQQIRDFLKTHGMMATDFKGNEVDVSTVVFCQGD